MRYVLISYFIQIKLNIFIDVILIQMASYTPLRTILIIAATLLWHIDICISFPGPSVAATTRYLSNNHSNQAQKKIPRHYLDFHHHYSTQLYAVDDNGNAGDNDDKTTTVGSSEYYQGFISRSINEEPTERVTGDAILGPTLKFAGTISLCGHSYM